MKRFTENPFLQRSKLPVGSKNIHLTKLGKDRNILVNQVTGEIQGTHVVAHKKVDSEKFIKTFANYMAFTFELTKAGNKALRVVMWALQENGLCKDKITLDKFIFEDFMKHYEHYVPELALSFVTFKRGLTELCAARIIAKAIKRGDYFINPHCMFNGDRVAFTTLIERNT